MKESAGVRGAPKQIEKAASRVIDSTQLLSMLTPKQRRYAACFVEFEGDWRRAAEKAGYSKSTNRDHIEGSDAMQAYMELLLNELAAMSAVTGAQVVARLNRIALSAEGERNYSEAIRANKLLGDTLGIWNTQAPATHINQEGQIINIVNVRPSGPVAIDDATRAILERNGVEIPAPILEAELVG